MPLLFANYTNDLATLKLIFTAYHQRDRLDVCLVFFCEDARGQSVGRIAIEHGHHALRDDWSAVQRLINKMHRAAGPLDAGLDCLPLRIKSGKGGQQAWMNVQDAVSISVKKFPRKHAHVSSEADQVDFTREQRRDKFAVMFFTAAAAPLNDERFDSSLRSFREASGARLIADHNRNLSIRDTASAHRIGECDHV